jgi:2-C-methyl-D-erythritol 4-phosphate cytidylyltransferase
MFIDNQGRKHFFRSKGKKVIKHSIEYLISSGSFIEESFLCVKEGIQCFSLHKRRTSISGQSS